MSFTSVSSLSTSTEQPLSPKSPPPPPLGLLDFYGKRKQMLKIQVLEREIALLQEELKSLEGLHPASRCCKELDTFVGCSSDPFTPTNHSVSKSHGFWKCIRLKLLCVVSLPWACLRCCCQLPKKVVKGCCVCCSSSSNSKCCGSCCCCCCCCLKKTTSSQKCCRVLKELTKPCAYCLVCFSCKSGHHCCLKCCSHQ